MAGFSLSNLSLGKTKAFWAMVLMIFALIPTIWLIILEVRNTNELIEEAARSLEADAAVFVERFIQYVERQMRDVEEDVLNTVVQEGYIQFDTQYNRYFEADLSADRDRLLAYPFSIHLGDEAYIIGRAYGLEDEVVGALPVHYLNDRISEDFGRINRVVRRGPYGAFRAIYMYMLPGGANRLNRASDEAQQYMVRGVKVDEYAVVQKLLPAAYQILRTDRRWPLPEDKFGVTIGTRQGILYPVTDTQAPIYRQDRGATHTYYQNFSEDGLFRDWHMEVLYFNQLEAGKTARYFYFLAPLLIMIIAIMVSARMVFRETELSRTKSAFVSNVSHELKTPISKIRFFNEMLSTGRAQPERQQYYFKVVEQECERLALLVDNVLDFSRIERGQMRYDFEPGPLAPVVRDVIDTFSALYETRGYSVSLNIQEDLPEIHLDANALKQALINLLDNAAKYSDPHTVAVRLGRENRRDGAVLCLSVQDEGIGIPSDKLKSIFKEFQRLENGLEQRIAGSGLGLSLVDHIVKAHGGRIEVVSHVGMGSTFTIVLPIASKPVSIKSNATETVSVP